MNKEYIRPFLSKTIKMCDKCEKMDIKTYAKYGLKNENYILHSMYSKCPRCGYTKEFTKEEIRQELK